MNTPRRIVFIYGTRHGSLFNLTPPHIPKVGAIHLCAGDFLDEQALLKALSTNPQPLSIKRFLGFPEETLMYLTPFDSIKEKCMSGFQPGRAVKILTSKGYSEITPQIYNQLVETLKPQIAVCLTEHPSLMKNSSEDSNRSQKRAIAKTKSFYAASIADKDNGVQSTTLLYPIHGGKNLALVVQSTEHAIAANAKGIVYCETHVEDDQQRAQIYNQITSRLDAAQNAQLQTNPTEKAHQTAGSKYIRCLSGLGRPKDILFAQRRGFNYFQVSYPFLAAEQHIALIETAEGIVEKKPVLKPDLLPLSNQCDCYACKEHSEAYIAHLIDNFEMTSKVLLSIHNCAVYQRLEAKLNLNI